MGNQGTYRNVSQNALKLMQETERPLTARATVASWNIPRTCENVKHLLSLGFRMVHVEPAVGVNGKVFIRTDAHIQTLKKEYDKLADYFLKGLKVEKPIRLNNFRRTLQMINKNGKKLHPCGAGKGYLAVGENGDVFPCHRFVGNARYCMGNVLTDSFDSTWEQKITENVPDVNREACSACWARYLCSGDCIAVAEDCFGDIRIPEPSRCELNKHIFELSFLLYAHIPKEAKVKASMRKQESIEKSVEQSAKP